MESHDTTSAMRRGELEEEEAYFVLRFAGRLGYRAAMRRLTSPTKRLRQWFIWFGGWETPELCQWDMGWPAWKLRLDSGAWRSPTPVSILGHRATWYGWGGQARMFGGLLTVSWRPSSSSGWRLYWSPDGTPDNPGAKCIIGRRHAT